MILAVFVLIVFYSFLLIFYYFLFLLVLFFRIFAEMRWKLFKFLQPFFEILIPTTIHLVSGSQIIRGLLKCDIY